MTLLESLICYFIYGFLGWVYESAFYTIQFKKPVNTGFLHGCHCPIYGAVCVLNVLILGNESRNWVIFFVSMIMVSMSEYIVSYLLEYFFEKRWWDYSEWPCNVNGRISLLSSLGFGMLSLIQIKFIHPAIMRWVDMIPKTLMSVAVMVFMIIMVIDIIYSLRNMDNVDEKLWFVEEDSEIVQKASEKFNNVRDNAAVKYADVKERIKDRMGRL